MKRLAVLSFLAIILLSCGFGDRVCFEKRFRPKSKAEVASMTTRQLVDEYIRIEPNAFNTIEEGAEYEYSIQKRIGKAGSKALPILTEYFNASYQKKSEFYCDWLRFADLHRLATDLDRFEFRLRGTPEGRQAIEAFERAIVRVEKPGFTDKDVSYYRTMDLSYLKGINEVDDSIRDTFWVRYRIEMSDEELLEFTNFLIELDPAYPSWIRNDSQIIKDYSRINEAGNPLQVRVINKPERFYEAYKRFKETDH